MKTRILHLLPAAKAALLWTALLATAACSGGSSAAIAGGGSTGGGHGGGHGPKYSWSDLNGDWIGQLTPPPAAAPGTQPRNVYLRWSDERLVEAAESGGQEFVAANSTRVFKFTARGALSADLQADAGSGRLLLSGVMDASLSVLEGTFQLTESDGAQRSGSFTLTRSAGASQFTQDMLAKRWDGLGSNGVGKFRFLKFELDGAGVVVDGLMKHPDTEVKIRDYSYGSGSYAFADSSVGRLNNVVMIADQGQTISFPFLLLSADGTLLAGAGVESELGNGVAELVPGL